MPRSMIVSAMVITLLMFTAAVQAQQAATQIRINDPYVRAVPPGQPNSAVFMKLNNKGVVDHALVGAESRAAKVVELHTHTMVDGMMRMRPVEKIDLPADKTVSLQPGGLHVMLIGLEQKLTPGEMIPLTLLYQDGSKSEISAPVRKLKMQMKKMQYSH